MELIMKLMKLMTLLVLLAASVLAACVLAAHAADGIQEQAQQRANAVPADWPAHDTKAIAAVISPRK